jgi:FKBP-type peptidyl-prolyl cis-trans isomerase
MSRSLLRVALPFGAFSALLVSATVSCADGSSAAQQAPAPGTMEEKASYAIGFNLGRNLRNDQIDASIDQLAQGLRDGFGETEPKISEDDMAAAVQELQQKAEASRQQRQAEAGAKNRADGEAFLNANAEREGVETLPSGLQYEVLSTGDGPKPSSTDVVRVHYHGTTIDGQVFDSSVDRGEPAVFPLNRVIAGWTEGLQLMPVGSKWKLYVPSQLAYGSNPPPGAKFGPDSVLVFEVELLAIETPGR